MPDNSFLPTTNYDDGTPLPPGVVLQSDGFRIANTTVRFYVEPVHGAGRPGPFPFPEGPRRKALLLERLWVRGRKAILKGVLVFDRRFRVPLEMETFAPDPIQEFAKAFGVLLPGEIVVYEQALVKPLEELGFTVRLDSKRTDEESPD